MAHSAQPTSRSRSTSRGRKRKRYGVESDSDFSFGEDTGSDYSIGDEGLPHQTSHWRIFDLESLGIFYNETFVADPTCMFDIMVKDEQPFEANPFLNQTLDSLKSKLSFDIPSINGLSRWSMTYANTVIKELYNNAVTLRESVCKEDDMLNVALSNAIDFTQRIAYLIERLYRKKPTSKHVYTGAVGAFARMCFWQDEVGNVYESEMRINDTEMVSVPDLRLKGTSFNSNVDYLSQQLTELVVSVVEEAKEPQTRSDKEGTEACSVEIHGLSFLDASVLGRHGGELLLEWEDSVSNPFIPGMIVSGTKVVMTLLHIEKEHVDRLKNNWNLVSDKDQATIYYAKPLDMLVKGERDLLLETFFKLSFINRRVGGTT